MTTTRTFTTVYGEDDTPVTITYTHTPACPATLEDPGYGEHLDEVRHG